MFGSGNPMFHGGTEQDTSYLHANPPPLLQQIRTASLGGGQSDEPISPDAAVAYHDQLRRASVTTSRTGRTRSNTATSITSSFKSSDSANTSAEATDLGRKLSGRSSVSKMTSRIERPDSNLFNKSIFQRSSRRKHESISVAPAQKVEMPVSGSARARYYGRSQSGKSYWSKSFG